MFSSISVHQNPGSGLDPDPDLLEMPDTYPYPDPDSINLDPQQWFVLHGTHPTKTE
jgi:hypothetical protein